MIAHQIRKSGKISLHVIFISLMMSHNAYPNYEAYPWQHAFSIAFGRSISHEGGIIKNIRTANFEKDNIFSIAHYKQPNHFFRVEGTRNIIAGTYSAPHTKEQIYFGGLSQSITFMESKNIYFNGELGVVYANTSTLRIGSRLYIMTNLELGININQYYSIGIVKHHFSNANLTAPNIGENFLSIVFGVKM